MDPTDPEHKGLRYLRVAASLRRELLQGIYPPGTRLPRQHDLAKLHNVSFTTLRHALDLLEQEGLLLRKAGQGTYAARQEDRAPVALIVDDDEGTCEYIARALATSGWKSLSVNSGADALTRVGDRQFDLIFLDLIMPGLNGPDAFKAIRKIDPDVLVVIVTAYPESHLVAQVLEVGPFAMMKKPFTLREIRNLLANVRAQVETPRP